MQILTFSACIAERSSITFLLKTTETSVSSLTFLSCFSLNFFFSSMMKYQELRFSLNYSAQLLKNIQKAFILQNSKNSAPFNPKK